MEMTSSERQRLLRKLKHGPKLGRKELVKWMLKQVKKWNKKEREQE